MKQMTKEEEKVFFEDMINFLDISQKKKADLLALFEMEGFSEDLLDELSELYRKEEEKIQPNLKIAKKEYLKAEQNEKELAKKVESEEEKLLAKIAAKQDEEEDAIEKELGLMAQKTKDEQAAIKRKFEDDLKNLQKEMEEELAKRLIKDVEKP